MAARQTLVSLAGELGVSRQTVSNAINAPERVKTETLARVRQAIAASGYRPVAAARQLRTRRSMDLAMRLSPATDGINGSILDRLLHALTESAQVRGYRLTLFTAADDGAEIAQYETLLHTADIDGFVLTSSHHDDPRSDWLREHDVPFVSFGRPWSDEADPNTSDHAWVDVDGGAGVEAATGAFLEHGHRRVGFLGWPAGSGAGDDRRAGWRRAMIAAGDTQLAALTVSVPDTVGDGARGATELLANGATALVCASDSLALGAASSWQRLMPQTSPDLAVIGFDDTPVAAAVGLSSVSQPIEAAAQHITSLLADVLSGVADESRPERHLLLEPTPIWRRSDPFITAPAQERERS